MREINSFEQHKSLMGAFIFDEARLRRLLNLITSCLSKKANMYMEVTFEDGLVYKTNSLEKIVDEENRPGKAIKEISFNGDDGDWPDKNYREISVNLGKEYVFEHVGISVSGRDRDWVYTTMQKLIENLEVSRQWYSFIVICLRDPYGFLSGLFLTMVLWSLSIIFISNHVKVYLGLLGFVSLPLAALIVMLLGHLVSRLFPSFVFEIGSQIQISSGAREARKNIFWGILITSILIPLLLRYVFHLL
jgi:hypothetical protein